MTTIGKERLNNWVNKGFDEKAVALVGTSVETLKQLLDTGLIPPHQPSPRGVSILPYQKELLKNGGYMYFAYPLVDRIRPHNSTLASAIDEDYSSDEDVIYDAKFYAYRNAWTHSFFEKTRVKYSDWQDLAAMTAVLFPRILRNQVDNPIFPIDADDFSDIDLIDTIRRNGVRFEASDMPLSQLKGILADCLARRGVLLYYNEGIFQHKVEQGNEDSQEIYIVSRKPLTASVISGVQILSNADKRALRSFK